MTVKKNVCSLRRKKFIQQEYCYPCIYNDNIQIVFYLSSRLFSGKLIYGLRHHTKFLIHKNISRSRCSFGGNTDYEIRSFLCLVTLSHITIIIIIITKRIDYRYLWIIVNSWISSLR